ncbi:DUF5131 family protein [Candidatus Dependentiae bacterium]|nr:MAG: DUF5131 family protein [Candidatus Dependentiae bacterium]
MNSSELPTPFNIAERVWDWRRDMLGPLGWRKHCLAILKDDLFAEQLPPSENLYACGAFGVMAARRFTQFIVWTNHPDRMREWLEWAIGESKQEGRFTAPAVSDHGGELFARRGDQATSDGLYRASGGAAGLWYPLANVRLATVVNNQEQADARIPELMLCMHEQCVIICDPLMETIDLRSWLHLRTCSVYLEDDPAERERTTCDCRQVVEQLVRDGNMGSIGWIVAGGGYGHKAKPCPMDSLVSLVQQGKQAGVPVCISRLGARPKNGRIIDWRPAKPPSFDPRYREECRFHAQKGDNVNEWPGILRVQERPRWAMLRSMLGGK